MSIFPVFDTASSALTDQPRLDGRDLRQPRQRQHHQVRSTSPRSRPDSSRRKQLPSNPGDPIGVGGGVEVASIQYGDSTGIERYEPGNPLANKQGLVRSPDVDVSQNMTDLIIAQRAYQLNLSVVSTAQQSYQQAIQINGK